MLVFPSHGENLPFSPPETSDVADCGFPPIPQLLTFTKRRNDPPVLLPIASAHPAHTLPPTHPIPPGQGLVEKSPRRDLLPQNGSPPPCWSISFFLLQFGFSRVVLQLSVEFGLPSAASRESTQRNKWGLGVIACFKVSYAVKALDEASALAVDRFIYMYRFNEGGKRHQ